MGKNRMEALCAVAALLSSASLSATTVAVSGGSVSYVYDKSGWLLTATYADGSETAYQFDAAGNRKIVMSGPLGSIPAGTVQNSKPLTHLEDSRVLVATRAATASMANRPEVSQTDTAQLYRPPPAVTSTPAILANSAVKATSSGSKKAAGS